MGKIVAKKRKEDGKQCITQLAKKRRNEKVAAEVSAAREGAHAVVEQKKVAEVAAAKILEAETVQEEEGQELSVG